MIVLSIMCLNFIITYQFGFIFILPETSGFILISNEF